MATQPQKPIKVDVWAWRDKDNGIQFDHDWQVQGNPAKQKGQVIVGQGEPATDITFQLTDDKTGLNLKFCSPASEAMYVGPAPNCPPPAGNGGQITYKLRQDKMLKVADANSVAALFVYALRFDGDLNPQGPAGQQRPPYLYDPELRNGGGGGLQLVSATSIAFIGAGAVSSVLATLLLNQEATAMTYVWGAVIGAIVGLVAGMFLGKRHDATV